jgi:excisionase family DNA binding protein
VVVLKVKDVAARLGVSPSTVYHLVEAARISCHRIGTGRGAMRFSEAQVEDFLRACRAEAGAPRPGAAFTHRRR